MTTSAAVTASEFLFGAGLDGVTALVRALDRQRALRLLSDGLTGLSRSGFSAVTTEVAAMVHGLLALDLGDLLIGGWRKYGALTAAARRTGAAPGSSEIVELVSHTVTSVHEPEVDVLVREVRVATIHIELSVEFKIDGLAATVWDGQLVALEGGSCDITASLAVEGKRLAERTRHTRAPLVVRVGDGVALLRDADEQPAEGDPPSTTER
jgi:hypothetical protein